MVEKKNVSPSPLFLSFSYLPSSVCLSFVFLPSSQVDPSGSSFLHILYSTCCIIYFLFSILDVVVKSTLWNLHIKILYIYTYVSLLLLLLLLKKLIYSPHVFYICHLNFLDTFLFLFLIFRLLKFFLFQIIQILKLAIVESILLVLVAIIVIIIFVVVFVVLQSKVYLVQITHSYRGNSLY